MEVRWVKNEASFREAQVDIFYVNIAAFYGGCAREHFRVRRGFVLSQVFHTCVQLPPFHVEVSWVAP